MRINNTENNCLVIIDLQKGLLFTESTRALPQRVSDFIGSAKGTFQRVVSTRFENNTSSSFVRKLKWSGMMDDRMCSIDEMISQRVKKVFIKSTYSCFTDEFKRYLEENEISKLTFVGVDTDASVLASAFSAFDYGIDFDVIMDLCESSGGESLNDAAFSIRKRQFGEATLTRSNDYIYTRRHM